MREDWACTLMVGRSPMRRTGISEGEGGRGRESEGSGRKEGGSREEEEGCQACDVQIRGVDEKGRGGEEG